jgi:hypothetical protein
MRGTLHFVAAADVRWMLALLTPRVLACSASRLLRQYELDEAVFAHSRKVLVRVLQGGRRLTRKEIYQALEAAGIPAAHQRGLQILWRLAQESLICFGPRRGKQPTFVLLDEWIPEAKSLDREQAMAELARRYFASHGPATLGDFAWWSGLSAADAQAGLETAGMDFEQETIDGQTYWFSSKVVSEPGISARAHLLPAYDEYTVAYKDRRAIIDPQHAARVDPRMGILGPGILIDGQVVGSWRRAFRNKTVFVTPDLLPSLKAGEWEALKDATARYGRFLGLPVTIE